MINTRAEAEAVVEAVKYPPQGKQGLASVRAANYGLTMSLEKYALKANQQTLVAIQVETLQAVSNLDELLCVQGVDVFFIGPNDLSTSTGYAGQVNHPEVRGLFEKLVRGIHTTGRIAGTTAYTHEALVKAKKRGFQYIVHGVTAMMAKSRREYLKLARQPSES